MNLKRYRVQNIQEALQQIKKDLGPDAIIVSTRQVKEGGGAFGMFSKTMLEVTAAKDEKVQQTKAKSTKAPSTATTQNNPQPQSTFSGYTASALPAKPMTTKGGTQPQEDVQKILLPLREEVQDLKNLIQGIDKKPAIVEQTVGRLKQDVSEIRQMIHSLASKTNQLRNEDLAENLIVLYQQMTFSGLEEKFAHRLVVEAEKNIAPKDLQNFSYVKIFVARMLMKVIKTTKGIEKINSRPRIITLVGPTGVGKTTTAAKIASEQMLKYQRKVAMLTVDTFRIGAVEQLQTYAKIINVPFGVISGKENMHRTLMNYSDYDVIIVDTAGRSQRDEEQMFALKEMFGNQSLMTNLLVLSATTKDSDLNEITRKFGEMPIYGIVFSKLDESTSYGSLFNHAIRFKKPITFLTTGQNVPEDIEMASKERMVDLLLNISSS